MDEKLQIGRVIKSHGIKGEVIVDPTTDVPEERFAIGEVVEGHQTGKTLELTIVAARVHKGRLLVKFEEIADRSAAESLRGMRFLADPREEDDDEGFYDHELEGLRVYVDGEEIGNVRAVERGVAHNLLNIRLAAGGDALVPFVEAIVPEVNVEEGTVTLTPPEGLLDL
ncbi:Ribosome maturation factor RimM [Corynebacterium ciconiae DSM 44920]|uniref:ribosome maturation factor RimM n=1 Tax=Corynebacterium ciconiae TaxID=227319 RepID=UPI00036E6083|nr:ribosome maturation factor RimM [Corynebacterium ciconiae]WKD61493.1 Ribosome maturation factor RimM [Corynebacterium ciconiae DSM 44920]